MRRVTRWLLGVVSLLAFIFATTLYFGSTLIAAAVLLFVLVGYTIQTLRER